MSGPTNRANQPRGGIGNREWYRRHIAPWLGKRIQISLVPATPRDDRDEPVAGPPKSRLAGFWARARRGLTPWVTLATLVLGITLILAFQARQSDAAWSEKAQRGGFWAGYLVPGVALSGAILFFGALSAQANELRAQREEIEKNRQYHAEQVRALKEHFLAVGRQNKLQERRDDVQWLLTVAASLEKLHEPERGPLVRVVMRRIVDQAEGDPRDGTDLLDLLLALCPTTEKLDWVTALDELWRMRESDYYRERALLNRMQAWFDVAARHIEHGGPVAVGALAQQGAAGPMRVRKPATL